MIDASNGRAEVSRLLSVRMALLGFISFNLTMASMWGSFGVLMTAIEAKMGVGRQVSSLAAPIVMIAVALLAPLAGAISGRISLRMLMMIGSLMGSAGFALVAVASNIEVLLLGYGLLIGPSVCLCGAVLPPTLVTRWFTSGRGRALGFVHLPIALVPAPLVCVFVLGRYGLSAVYIMLSAVMALNLVAQAFVQDYPPRTNGATLEGARTEPTKEFGATSFARAFGLGNMVSLPLTVLAVPLAASVYVRSASYAEALLIQSAFFLVAALLVLVVGGKRVSILQR